MQQNLVWLQPFLLWESIDLPWQPWHSLAFPFALAILSIPHGITELFQPFDGGHSVQWNLFLSALISFSKNTSATK